MVTSTWQLSNLESGLWSIQSGPTINPVTPDYFAAEPVSTGLQVFCASSKPYAGALAKQVNPLPWESSQVNFFFNQQADQSLVYGQVIETDTKFTDSHGWTYDGSIQINLAEGMMLQTGNPWVDTGTKLAGVPLPVSIIYKLDYVAHTIQIVSYNSIKLNLQPLAAQQLGWTPSEIVTQLQLCTASAGGAYDLVFSGIGYTGSN